MMDVINYLIAFLYIETWVADNLDKNELVGVQTNSLQWTQMTGKEGKMCRWTTLRHIYVFGDGLASLLKK